MDLKSRKGRLELTLGVTLVHMALTVLFFLWSFSAVMAHADDGLPLQTSGRVLLWLSQAFQAPLFSLLARVEILQQLMPNYFLFIVLFLNSLLWGLAVMGIAVSFIHSMRQDTEAV